MTNQKIRETAKEKGVALWQVADKINISEPTMTRKLRHELSKDETERILSIISELAEEKESA